MQPTYYVKHPDGSFSEVPAASGQPDALAEFRLQIYGSSVLRPKGRDAGECRSDQTVFSYDELIDYGRERFTEGVGKASRTSPDIGRDAALEEAARVCESLYSYPEEDGSAAVDGNLSEAASRIRALATQAAPEVASVPDAGQAVDAILLSDMVDGATHPGYGSGLFATANCVTTLYTRPQPAPSVLTDEQISEIAENYKFKDHYRSNAEAVKFARAVLAAARSNKEN